ncbi:TdeIII family type II restriction endonuclease [Pontibacter sp. FD36]|uniref:TdeIII family type II restriction endonuclease n=1 Tax=Pontibacter sp. FD36 TaxID=2789860 RepID=UPI0018AA5A0E|nr:TdeIII family type II restriction endonuclease [Pontibacter sp. FD36]MBF8962959.1 TdeIII family type II restriction endonuclease [Pontibacter sp. FD36]
MDKKDRVALAIKEVVTTLMDRVMNNVLVNDPFIKEKHRSAKPLYAALVPDEIFKGSHFERRFVTPFGNVWERLARVVAIEAHGGCLMGHSVSGTVGSESLRRIQEVLNGLEHKTKGKAKEKPDWEKELAYIKAGGGELIPVSVTCDIFIHNEETDTKYAFELKAPLPNSDQTKVSKEKMFKLLAMTPKQVDFAYYALPYNPYGKKEDYNWSFPMRWFDMHNDESVLIGNEFWDLIGGEGTYSNFIKEVNELGKEYRERIYKEFLEIEPPEKEDDILLK